MTTVSENALAELNVSMNADIKQRWVEALRSGQYKQGQGCLKQNDAYCCLGVLCELHRQDFPGKGWQRKNQHGGQFSYISRDAVNYPPEEMSAWTGLNPSVYDLLADANDSGADFPTIASLIEEML